MPNSHDPAAVAAARETRLADYRPPAFLVDTVELDFALDPHATVVRSRLALRRNPAARRRPRRCASTARRCTLLRIALDGEPLGANRYRLEDGTLVIADLPDAGVLEIETAHRPRTPTPSSPASTSRTAASSPSARPRASAASPISPTGPT